MSDEKDNDLQKIVFDVLDEETGRTFTYYTKDVAEKLNITQQMVRNYCNTYPEIFNSIPTTSSGRRLFNANSIELLKRVIHLSRDLDYSKEEVINAVKSSDASLLYENEQKSLVSDILNRWQEFFVKNEEANRQLLLTNNENNIKIEKLSVEVKELSETNGILTEKINEISDSNKTLCDANNELKHQIEELKSLLLENRDTINEIKDGKKRGFFGFLKR